MTGFSAVILFIVQTEKLSITVACQHACLLSDTIANNGSEEFSFDHQRDTPPHFS